MPYGVVEEYHAGFDCISENEAYGNVQRSSIPVNQTDHVSFYRRRTGTNSPREKPARLRTVRRGSYKLVPYRLKKGPKLSYKTFDSKTRKWYWERDFITIYKRKWVWEKRQKRIPAIRSYVKPNWLTFEKRVFRKWGDENVSSYHPYDPNSFKRRIICPLWYNFSTLWGATMFDERSYQQGPITVSDRIEAVSDLALAKLYENIHQAELNVGQMLAERRQTVRMIEDISSRLFKAALAAKRGNLGSAAKELFPVNSKKLANDELMVQYGIRPLLSDLRAAQKELNRPMTYGITVRGIKKVTVPMHFIVNGYSASGVAMKQTVTREAVITVRWVGHFTVRNYVSFETSRFGLNISSIPSLMYELTPWSFVIDWILPIGNWLKNAFIMSDVQTDRLYRTVHVKETCTGNRTFGGVDTRDGYIWDQASSGWMSEKVLCTRELRNEVPPLPFPTLKSPLSAEHGLNALALLTQLFKRK